MPSRLKLTLAFAFAAMLQTVASNGANEDKPKIEELPKPVSTAVNNRFPGGQITSAQKETENNNVVFDIELTLKDRKYEMDILENGTVVEIEKEVVQKDWPKPLAPAIDAKYPGAVIKEVMEVNKVAGKVETPDHYEVTLATAADKSIEVLVSLDGKTVTVEAPEEPKKDSPEMKKVTPDSKK